MKNPSAIEYFEDSLEMQGDYYAMLVTGFRNKRNETIVIQKFMDKYGFTHDEALAEARGRLTHAERLNILRRENEKD